MNRNISARKVALVGLFVALSYIGTQFNIPISVGGGKTMFHFGNAFLLLASFMLGGVWGGASGAIGMTLFDLTSAGFQVYAPQTFILKFCIGLICGTAYKKLQIENDTVKTVVSCSLGMLFNVIVNPLFTYFTSKYLIGMQKDFATVLTTWATVTTFTNAVVVTIGTTLIYRGLRLSLLKEKMQQSSDTNEGV